MADYIDDTGNSNKDALLGGTYTTDAPNKTLTLGADGTADSEFILPDDGTHWMIVETYDIEGVAGNLGGHWWTTDVPTGLQAYIQEKQAIADAEYTTYKIVATHYKGNDLADVYIGSETVPFPTTADKENEPFTPPVGNWIITDTPLAPLIELSDELLPASPSHLDAGWTDNADGTYTSDGTTGSLQYYTVMSTGNNYRCVFEVVSISSGTVTNMYASTGHTYHDAIGTYTDDTTAGGNTARYLSQGSVCTIRPISVKQIL